MVRAPRYQPVDESEGGKQNAGAQHHVEGGHEKRSRNRSIVACGTCREGLFLGLNLRIVRNKINNEIKNFCEAKFGITFPMTEKVVVKGDLAHPFYAWAEENFGKAAALPAYH